MTEPVKIIAGRDAQSAGTAFLNAWERAEHGEAVRERVLSFESWDRLASVITGQRYRLLRHLHSHPEPSISALARALGRQYRRVHADVAALEGAGLVERADSQVRATTDTIQAEIRL